MSHKAAPDYASQEFIITREFDAPRKLVWKACTDAAHLARWWGPKGFTAPVCEWNARPGNKIHVVMRAPNGADYPMGGRFHEVVAPERLVTTTGALDGHGRLLFQIRHTMTLVERRGKTVLTMHSKVVKTTPGAGRFIGGFEAGMTQSLARLAVLLESAGEPVVIERTFAASADQVWQALASVESMRRWFFDLKDFRPEVGFRFQFTAEHKGFTYSHQCRVTAVIPGKRIAFTWRYRGHEGDSLVTIDLVASGKQTRLKLTHEGLETFPKSRPFARKNFLRGWTSLIGACLKNYLAAAPREIVISRELAAPRERVWEAMTNPGHLVHWWGPEGFTTTIEAMDFRVGGKWKQVMHGPDGTHYPNQHRFKEIVRPERIVFAQSGRREGGPGVSFVATWTFDQLGPGKTRVTIRMVFPSAKARDYVVREFGAIEGGKQTLERFGKYLAKT